jgi:hypothetical protein
MCVACGVRSVVAQICNLPYRRIVFGGASDQSEVSAPSDAPQSTTLRYDAPLSTYLVAVPFSGSSGPLAGLVWEAHRAIECASKRTVDLGTSRD